MSSLSSEKLRWLPVVVLLLIMTVLGAARLNDDAIWLDEWWSIYHAGGAHYGPVSIAETWSRVANEDPWNAPGYYTLLKGWGALVGWTAYADRALSLLFGVLAAAMAYRMGRDVGNSHVVGLGTAVALGGSAFFIYYLHELRAYTLYAFLVTFTMWAYWRVVYRGGSWRAQFGLFFGVAAMLYTHYFSALLATALGLYHLLFVIRIWDMRTLRTRGFSPLSIRPLILMAAGGALFLPWVGVLIDGLRRGSNAAVRQEPISEALTMLWTLAYAFSSAFIPLLLIIFAAALISLITAKPPREPRELESNSAQTSRLYSPFLHKRSDGEQGVGGIGVNSTIFAWFIALTVLILALALNAYMSVNAHARHFIVLLPPLALLAGIGIQELARHRISPAIILTLWLATAVWNSFTDFNDVLFGEENQRYFRIYLPWNVMADELRADVQEGDIIAFSVPEDSQAVSGAFEYYMRPLNVPIAIVEWWTNDETQVSEFQSVASSYTQNAMRLWLGQETDQPSGEWLTQFREVIDPNFVSCNTSIELNGLRAELYAQVPQCCHAPQTEADRPLYTFGTSVALTFAQPELNGDSLRVLLAWLGGDTLPPYQYSVALHITPVSEAAQSAPLAQVDYGMPLDDFACRAADIPLTDLPAGEYNLSVIVYNWQTNERLTTQTGDSGVIETFEVGN